jgi:hypothetical protein
MNARRRKENQKTNKLQKESGGAVTRKANEMKEKHGEQRR